MGIAPIVLFCSLAGRSFNIPSWGVNMLIDTTRHRPYLALFEQSLCKHVHEIAAEYKNAADKERYLKAAARFRLP